MALASASRLMCAISILAYREIACGDNDGWTREAQKASDELRGVVTRSHLLYGLVPSLQYDFL